MTFSKLLIIYMAFLWICKSQRHVVYGTATALIHCNNSTKRTRELPLPQEERTPPLPCGITLCHLPDAMLCAHSSGHSAASHTSQYAALQQVCQQPGASGPPSATSTLLGSQGASASFQGTAQLPSAQTAPWGGYPFSLLNPISPFSLCPRVCLLEFY